MGDETDATRAMARLFEKAWARPRVDDFMALLHPDVVLEQPVTPTIRGIEAARRDFARLLQWLPEAVGTVHGWAASGDTLFVEWVLRARLGGAPLEVPMVDRIVVRDALIVHRTAFFDSARVMRAVSTRPSSWTGFLRYRGLLGRS
jgi:ketosteroid isomerase-like protein